jgi:transposase-like protein
MVEVKVSKNGENVTIVRDDGKEITINFQDFVNMFKNTAKALNEYYFHIVYHLGREGLSEEEIKEVIQEIKAKMIKECPHCHGRLIRAGYKVTRSGKRQRFQCTSCGRYVF